MTEVALAHVRYAWSMLTGRPFHLASMERLVDTLLETRAEFGEIRSDDMSALGAPALDAATTRDLQVRRLRKLARRAENETPYYRGLFTRLGLEPGRLAWDDIAAIPVTPKEALQDRPDAFVRAGQRIAFRSSTTGTTGKPATTYVSEHDLRLVIELDALGMLARGLMGSDDVVQSSISSRAMQSILCFGRACERVGAAWYQTGMVDPGMALDLLREVRSLPGKQARTTFLNVYSSYLGEMVSVGLAAGLGPEDFGLRLVSAGAEVLSSGLKRRARRLFGADVRFDEVYGMTETWPFNGQVCEQGHLHFHPIYGLLEVLDPETWLPTAPGQVGTIVATPFPPYRESSVLLRYDTQDLARVVDGPLTCSQRLLPATSDILGKRRLSVRHAEGWTTPRDVFEALEGIDEMPVPARCGFWSHGDGVAVEVVAPAVSAGCRSVIGDALEARRVPVRELHIVEDRGQLRHPFPLRCDLREAIFA